MWPIQKTAQSVSHSRLIDPDFFKNQSGIGHLIKNSEEVLSSFEPCYCKGVTPS